MAQTQTTPWDPAEHLQTEEDMVDYLNVALEEDDLPLIVAALGDITRAWERYSDLAPLGAVLIL